MNHTPPTQPFASCPRFRFPLSTFIVLFLLAAAPLHASQIPPATYWLGQSNSTWSGTNWASNAAGNATTAIPTSTSNITLSATGAQNQTPITLDVNATIKTLTVNATAGLSGNKTLTVNGGGGATIGGNLTLSNGVTANITGGTVIDAAGTTASVTVNGANLLNSNLIVGNAGNASLAITGNGSVSSSSFIIGFSSPGSTGDVTVSDGTLTNSLTNFYVGVYGNGTLNVTGNGTVNALSNGTGLVTLAYLSGSVGTLNIGTFGGNSTAGTFNAGEVTGGNGAATVNFNQTDDITFAPKITGSAKINQLGTGTTVLAGNSTYTGATTISSGALYVNGDNSFAPGNVTVQSGATLSGSGKIGGNVTVESGATITAGNNATSTGYLSLAKDLTLASGSTALFQFASSSAFDRIGLANVSATGNITLSLQFTDSYTGAAGDTFNIFNADGFSLGSANFSVASNLGSQFKWDLSGLSSNGTVGIALNTPGTLPATHWLGQSNSTWSGQNWASDSSGTTTTLTPNSNSTITLSSTGAQNQTPIILDVDATIASLTVNATAGLAGNKTLTVSGSTTIGNGDLTLSNGVTLLSNGNDTSSVIAPQAGQNGSVTVNGGNWTSSRGSLTVGGNGTGTLSISNGTVSNTNGRIGLSAGSSGNVTVSGGNWKMDFGTLTVGGNGSGRLTLTSGNISSSTSSIGDAVNSNGTVTVSGGTWTTSRTLFVGSSGTGTLSISNGTVSNNSGRIGANSASNGTVTVSGGNWTNAGALIVGSNGTGTLSISNGTVSSLSGDIGGGSGSNGSVTVSGGNWTNSDFLRIGTSGMGTLSISNGTVSNNSSAIGAFSGSNGNVTVSGGNWRNSGILTVGRAGAGTLQITDNGSVSANSVVVASSAGSTGTVNLLGGVLSVGQLSRGSGIGTVIFNGGTLQLTGNQSSLFSGFGSTDVVLTATGATIDTQAFNVATAQVLTGNGSLTKEGSGALTLTGNNTHTGGTSINAGKLILGTGGRLVASTGSSGYPQGGLGGTSVTLNSSSILQVETGASIAGGLGGNGGLERNGGSGGNGVLVSGNGTLKNSGTIIGGNGGNGGDGDNVNGGNGGNGGNGIQLNGGGIVDNSGTISGGSGGKGGVGGGLGSNSGNGGSAGTGVLFQNVAGTLINRAGAAVTGGVVMGDFANNVTLEDGSSITGGLNIGTSSAATLTLAGTGTQTYSAAVDGNTSFNGQLLKTGSGTWVLDQNFSYSGPTTVSAGTLCVNGDNTNATGDVVVLGGTLGGTGKIGGNVTVQSGGTITSSPDLPGTLTINKNLTLEDGSTALFKIGGPGVFDQISLKDLASSGNITLGLQLVGTYTGAAGDSFRIFNADTYSIGTTNFNITSNLGSNFKWDLSGLGNNGTVRIDLAALAATHWLGQTGVNWSGANWASDAAGNATTAIPASSDNITFSAAGAQNQNATVLDQDFNIASLTVNSDAGITGNKTLTINGGTGAPLNLPGNSGYIDITTATNQPVFPPRQSTTAVLVNSGNLTISGGVKVLLEGNTTIDGAGNGAALTVTGANTKWNETETITNAPVFPPRKGVLSVGVSNGNTGALNVLEGATVNSSELVVGDKTGSTGNVAVSGAGSKLTSDFLDVGSNGTGNLTVESGGEAVTNKYASIATNSGSVGTATVTGAGSKWTIGNNLTIDSGGTGSLNILDGGVVSDVDASLSTAAGIKSTVTVDGAGSQWNNSGNVTVGDVGPGTLNIQNGGSVSVGGGTLTLGARPNSSGALNIGAFGGNSTAGTLNAAEVKGGNGTATVNFNQKDSLTFAPNITGSTSVNALRGTTTLSGNVSYSGPTTIANATLNFAGDMSGLTGDITNGGTLGLGQSANTTYSGNITGTGTNSIDKSGNGTVTFSGTVSSISNTFVNVGTLNITGDMTGLHGNILIGDEATLGLGQSVDTTYDGSLSGKGNLVKFGSATTTIDNLAPNYTGTTTIQSGTLNFAADTSQLTGNIVNDGVLKFTQTANSRVSGIISGSGRVDQSGPNRLVVSGSNTYTGGTTINTGVVQTENAGALGTGAVTINGGALRAIGQLNTGNLTWNAGTIGLAPVAGDVINVAGAFTSGEGGGGLFSLAPDGMAPNQAYTLVNFETTNFNLNQFAVIWSDPSVTFNSSFILNGDSVQIMIAGATASGVLLDNIKDVPTYANYTTIGSVVSGLTASGFQELQTFVQNLFVPNSSLLVPTPNVLTVTGFMNMANSTLNVNGRLNVLGNFTDPNSIINVTGSMSVAGNTIIEGNSSLTVAAGGTYSTTGSASFTSSTALVNGTLTTGSTFSASNSTVTVNGSMGVGGAATFDNNSRLTVNPGALMTVGSTTSISSGSQAAINGQLTSPQVNVNSGGLLTGAGLIAGSVSNSGTVSPGNSPGTLTITGTYTQSPTGTLIMEIASQTVFDRLIVGGNANLGGTLQVLATGFQFAYGQQFPVLQAGSISGQFASMTTSDPSNFRVRFLVNGGTGTILIAPTSYTLVAQTQNQKNAAKALNNFIKATSGDKQTVSIALDLQSEAQYPAAFDAIAPTFYESLTDITIEQTNARAQMLAQRASAVRLGSRGFQAIGIEAPLKYDKDGRGVMDAKDGKNILSPADDNNWGVWVQGNGIFAHAAGIGGVSSYNFQNGGVLVGGDYRWSEHFVTGVYGGYQGTYSKYGNGGVTTINAVDFGLYAGYQNGGFYTDAILGGGSSSYAVRRPIQFSTVDRTAISRPDGGQFTSYLGLGYDWQAGNFTFGPVLTGQYTYAGIAPFTENGAGALDLAVGQQNASSLRTSVGGRIAYTWKLSESIALIPEGRLFWQHEFLENPRNISSSLDGGGGPSFDYTTSAPDRDAVFAGAGISAQFGPNWNAYIYYNADFGRQDYISHAISTGLNFKF